MLDVRPAAFAVARKTLICASMKVFSSGVIVVCQPRPFSMFA